MEYNYNKLLKCILIGNTCVGKSSFCNKLVGYEFPYSYQSTIGVDFFSKIITINNQNMKLQIWDTAGQEKYKSITKTFYRNTKFVFLMFDLANINSFLNLKNWLIDVNTFCDNNIIKVLIGNKSDLKTNVSLESINNLCIENDIKYYSCSVKNNDMYEFLKMILEDNLEIPTFNHFIIDDSIININNKQNKKCCNIL
jgi:small GTP-binding protein